MSLARIHQVINKVNADLQRVLVLPDVKEKIVSQGGDPTHSTPEVFGAFMRKEYTTYSKIIQAAAIKVD